MKGIVVYYSLTDHCHSVATEIKDQLGFDILRLTPKKETNSGKAMKIVWGSLSVVMRQKPELLPFNFNPEEYDIIVFGTPIWASTYVPTLKTFFSLYKERMQSKKIVLYAYFSGRAAKTFENMKKDLPNNEFILEKEFCDKNTKEAQESQIKEFVVNLKEKVAPSLLS